MSENAIKPGFEPFSIQSEQSLLGILLTDTVHAFTRIEGLTDEHFYEPSHKAIFRQAKKLYDLSKEINIEELAERSNVEYDYLIGLYRGGLSYRSAPRFANHIKDLAKHRSILEASEKALEIAEQGGDLSEKLDKVTSLFAALNVGGDKNQPVALSDVALMRTEYYDQLASGTLSAGWTTGLHSLDSLLNGGLRPGALYYLAARPSVGKSSLAAQIGLMQAKDNRNVLFLSQEMTKEEVADRAIANTGRVHYGSLQTGKDIDWGRTTEALQRKSLQNIFVSDQGGLTLMDIRTKAKQVKGLKVLILDYLQLCAGKGDNRNSEIEVISRGLKTLAKELDIAVIALSQLNREVEKRPNKKPILADLRDSGSIEQDADAVFLLWPVRDMENGRLLGLAIAKNRQGRIGEVALHFEGQYQQWHESTEKLEYEQQPYHSKRHFEG